MVRKNILWGLLILAVVGTMLFGCAAPDESGDGGDLSGSDEAGETGGDFPVKDPSKPFALNEKGLITLKSDQPIEITVQRDSGEALFVFAMKSGGIVDPEVDMTVQTIQPEMPEELAEQYVPVGQYALEMHAASETGYGFMLRPKIMFYYTDDEIASAKSNGASLDELKGNLFILYKEQRSPQWVPQKSVSIDSETRMVTVSNIAGTGAWWLVAVKAQ